MLRNCLLVLGLACVLSCSSWAQEVAKVKPETKPASKTNTPKRIWVNLDYYGLFGSETEGGIPMVTSRRWDNAIDLAKPGGFWFYWGEMDAPGVKVLYGKDSEGYPWSHGFKGDIGGWIDSECKWAAELGGFCSPSVSDDQTFRTNASAGTWLAAPFYNASLGYEDSVIIGLENTAQAYDFPASVKASSRQALWGIGASGYRNVVRNDTLDLDALFGFRFVNLSEEMQVAYHQQNYPFFGGLGDYLSGGLFQGARATASDYVKVDNNFYGANLGVRLSVHVNRFLFEVKPQVALGVMDQNIDTIGSGQVFDAANALLYTSPGGIFARPGTLGERSKTRFAFVPNVDVKVGVRITDNLAFNAGYSFLYLGDVVRAGNQLDRRINLPRSGIGIANGLPTAVSRPFETDDWMGHAVTAGFTIKF